MAGRRCRTVLQLLLVITISDAAVEGAADAADPGAEQEVPLLEDVQMIQIRVPLTPRDWGWEPCPAPEEECGDAGGDCSPSSATTTTTTTAATTAATGDGDATDADDVVTESTASGSGEVVIPEVAIVEVFFSNGSLLESMVTSFLFSGVFEVTMNRTERSVEVLLIRLDANVSAMEESNEPLTMVIRGPNIIGLSPLYEDEVGEDDGVDADDEFAEVDEDEENDDDELAGNEASPTDVSLESRSRWPKGRRWSKGHSRFRNGVSFWPKGRRRSKNRSHRAKTPHPHPVYINGEPLRGEQLCNIVFNMSGVFRLNRTLTESTTTVVVTQLNGTSTGGIGLLRSSKAGAAPTSGGVAASTLFLIAAVAAGIVLVAAITVTIIRSSRRSEPILQAGGIGYGTIESPNDDGWRYYNDYP